MTERASTLHGAVAIVPARQGSKGIPGKNRRALAGRSLVLRAVDAASAAARVDRTLVTTDDPEVMEMVRAERVEVIERPVALAGDEAELIDVVLHACETAGIVDRDRILVLLQPTSPLRTAEHIDRCVEMLVEDGRPAVLSVTEADHHPKKMVRVRDGSVLPYEGREWLHRSRQELDPVFRQNGAVYAIRLGVLSSERSFCPEGCGAFEMSREESVDIDDPLDLALCEVILARRQR